MDMVEFNFFMLPVLAPKYLLELYKKNFDKLIFDTLKDVAYE